MFFSHGQIIRYFREKKSVLSSRAGCLDKSGLNKNPGLKLNFFFSQGFPWI